MRYVCKQGLRLEKFDDDGFCTEGYVDIEAGEVFERDEEGFRVAGGPDTIRLENEKHWMEILPETLNEFFEPVEE